MHEVKEEKRNRDRETTARAQKAVRVLHDGFVSKDKNGKSTRNQQLVRGLANTMFKQAYADRKVTIKALEGDTKAGRAILTLVADDLANNAEDLANTIAGMLTDVLIAVRQACEPGVKCKFDYNAIDIAQAYVGFNPTRAIKDADMARASDL
jgi:hypothetical protein